MHWPELSNASTDVLFVAAAFTYGCNSESYWVRGGPARVLYVAYLNALA